MRFGVLGPVEVRHDGESVPTGSGRERFVLATLLLNAGKPVRPDVLVDALWPEPPPTAKAQLHNLISKIRRRLRVSGDEVVVSGSVGYELCLGAHELDLLDFEHTAARGRAAAAAGDHALAATLFGTALSLWRGPALADVADELAAATREALHDQRFAVAEARLDAELALGQHEDVLRGLPELIAEQPFRESLHEKHLIALEGVGRRADALARYRQVQRMFADELGIEPSLHGVAQRLLRGDAATRPVPRQLPAQLTELAGRDELLEEIIGAVRTRRVVLLIGPGGVGKSALALAACHRLAFPDGQLYADLRGSRDPHDVAGQFLRALGVDPAALPTDPGERFSLYRSQLATRRMLVVLDDATAEEQVRPLLPGTEGCRTVITSRHRLGALLGVTRRTVPVLSQEGALRLIADAIGHGRVAAEPDAAAGIAELCARLPLALAVAAARLTVNPHLRLDAFRQRLARERHRLDELAVGDLDVRASIAVSYDALDPDSQTLLRRIGIVATGDWPAWVAGTTAPDRLVDAHMVEALGADPVGQQRFRLHDLVADFARERASAQERDAVLTEVACGWLALATEADERLPLVTASPVEWFEVEWRGLVAMVEQTCELRPDIAGALALRLAGFFWLRSYNDEWVGVLRRVLSHTGDHLGLLDALFEACEQRQRYAELPGIAEQELTVARELGDREGEIRALRRCGQAKVRLGRLGKAADVLERAVRAARAVSSSVLLRDCLATLGWIRVESGLPGQALPLFDEVLAISEAGGESVRVSLCLYHLGIALTDLGRLDDAAHALDRAREIARALNEDEGEAYLQQALADVDIRARRWPSAATRLDRARHAHQKIGNRDGLAEVWRATGDLAAATGRWPEAAEALNNALDLWRAIGAPLQQARTLARLERALTALADTDAAAACAQECAQLLTATAQDPTCLRLPVSQRKARSGT